MIALSIGLLLLIAQYMILSKQVSNSQTAYEAALEHIERSIEVARFKASFPDAQCHITYFTGVHGPTSLQCKAVIYDRYILRLEASLIKDGEGQLEPSKISYHLWEVRSVMKKEDGVVDVSYEKLWEQFDSSQAALLFTNGWDFTSLGLQPITNAPVANISILVDR